MSTPPTPGGGCFRRLVPAALLGAYTLFSLLFRPRAHAKFCPCQIELDDSEELA